MITITQDAEFMTNLVSANPIPAGNRFVAFVDENLNPAVLSHSEDNKLNLVLEVDGKATLFDFGEICGLSGEVQAFDLLQESDLNVWISVATDAGNGFSNFYLIIHLKPSVLLHPPSDSIIQSNETFKQIHGIYMSNFTRNAGGLLFPLLFLALQPKDRITQEDQLGYVNISVDNNKNTLMSLNTSWKLAVDTLKIIDVSFGNCRLGKGAFVLYETAGSVLKLQFRVFEDGRDFSVELDAPPGALCLTAYNDYTADSTVFLVGGDVITQYKYADYNKSTGEGTTIVGSSDSKLGIKDIHHAQADDKITVWYTTGADGAYYYSATTSSMSDGLLVRLLPDGKGGRLSGLLSANNSKNFLVNTLISVDETGDLTILQQASDTGVWEVHNFYIPSTTNNLEIDSFTIRIKAHSDTTADNNEKLSGCKLNLTSSGFVRVQNNGKTASLDQQGAWFQADHSGTVTLIISTEDMSCQTLQIVGFLATNGTEIKLSVPVLNPSDKLNQKLKNISKGSDLLNAKTQTGENLIEPGSITDEEAEYAANMISTLNTEQMKKGGQPVLEPPPSGPGVQGIVILAGRLPTDPKILDALAKLNSKSGSSPWDFFYFIWKKAKEVGTWILQKIGDAIHFVVEWAGEIFNFVCDTIATIGKAISWVFNKIAVGIKKLIEFIGFLFKWNDILEFSDSISLYINVAFQYGASKIDELEEKTKTFVEDLRKQLKARVEPASVAATKDTKDPNSTDMTDGAKSGVAYNWSSYQISHGGLKNDSTMDLPTGTDEQDPFTRIWKDLTNEIEVIKDMLNTTASTITALFDKNTSSDELFEVFTDKMIDGVCDSLKNIVDILSTSISLAINLVSDIGNHVMEIPILSTLWKWISKGRPFTVFNCIALVAAIPATVIYKLVTDTKLPALAGRLTSDTFGKFLSNDPTLDSQLAKDIGTCRTVTTVVIGFIVFEVAALTFAWDEIFGVADVASSGVAAGALVGTQDHPGVSVGVLVGNITDTITLSAAAAHLFFSWPLGYGRDVNLHWWSWGLDLSNAVALVISRSYGWITGTPRVETKRFMGVFEVATGIPVFILELIIAVHDFQLPDGDPEKDDALTTRKITEDVFQLISVGGFCVAAVADEIQPEVSVVGLAVFGLSTIIKLAFVFVDVVSELKNKKDTLYISPTEDQKRIEEVPDTES